MTAAHAGWQRNGVCFQRPNGRAVSWERAPPSVRQRTHSHELTRSIVARDRSYAILVQRPPNKLSYEGLPSPRVRALTSAGAPPLRRRVGHDCLEPHAAPLAGHGPQLGQHQGPVNRSRRAGSEGAREFGKHGVVPDVQGGEFQAFGECGRGD